MVNFNDATGENTKERNSNWPQFPNYSYRILLIRGCASPETKALFNLISN